MRRSLIAGVVLVLALGACGSTARTASKADKVSTLALVTGSPDAAADAGSARMIGNLTLTVDSRTRTVPIDGVVDFRSGGSRLKMDLATLGLPGGGEIEARLVDGVMYMKLGDLFGGAGAPSLLRDKQWVKMDLSELGADATGSGDSPASMLESLRGAGNVERVGREEIRGIATTHFRATVDVAKALAQIDDPELRRQAKKGLDTFGREFPIDAWIDDDGLTRRFSIKLEAGSAFVSESIEFTDYGVTVDIERATRVGDDGPGRADRHGREPRQLRHGFAAPVAW